MATVRMQFRDHGFATVNIIGETITIEAPTWRAKRWAIRQVKREASNLGISLVKKSGFFIASGNRLAMEGKFAQALRNCWGSPSSREVKKALRHQIPFIH